MAYSDWLSLSFTARAHIPLVCNKNAPLERSFIGKAPSVKAEEPMGGAFLTWGKLKALKLAWKGVCVKHWFLALTFKKLHPFPAPTSTWKCMPSPHGQTGWELQVGTPEQIAVLHLLHLLNSAREQQGKPIHAAASFTPPQIFSSPDTPQKYKCQILPWAAFSSEEVEKEGKNASVQPWMAWSVHVLVKPSGEAALFLPGPEGAPRKM